MVERRTVDAVVEGSSPFIHPGTIKQISDRGLFLYRDLLKITVF